ncbi:MAG: MBL fold metallo-hydrolase [Treponema sp.]|nr:MBL fold metallo-hydrolase [Treponema sp.]
MKLFFHYCPCSFSNCYILGTEFAADTVQPREAIIIDPSYMDEAVLNFIEDNEYHVLGVLITHDHRNHIRGLRTLKRIYDVEIYGMNHHVADHQTTLVRDGDVFNIGPFCIEVISVPGHAADEVVFKIDHLLFTGDALSAGLVGQTASSYGATIQISALRNKILPLPGDYTVLPGHGPPSSLEAERRFNAGIQLYEQRKNERPRFTRTL